MSGLREHLVCLWAPDSWEAERYRALRHALVARFAGTPTVVAITSPGRGDGKTTISINLAACLAEIPSRRVLLIDADLRAGVVAGQVGISEQATGLAQALSDTTLTLESVIERPSFLNFSVVPAGKLSTFSAHQVIESRRFAELVTEARRSFSVVLIDTPPLTPVSDCHALSQWVDGFLVVVSANRTPRELLADSLDAIAPEKVFGLVLNGDDQITHQAGYHRRYYAQTYGSAYRSR